MALDNTNPAPDPQAEDAGKQTPETSLRDALRDLRTQWAVLPVYDRRSADEIIGYDEHGLPT